MSGKRFSENTGHINVWYFVIMQPTIIIIIVLLLNLKVRTRTIHEVLEREWIYHSVLSLTVALDGIYPGKEIV